MGRCRTLVQLRLYRRQANLANRTRTKWSGTIRAATRIAQDSIRAFAGACRLVAICGFVTFATPTLAGAFGDGFGGAARGLSTSDITLLNQAVRTALEAQEQGAYAVWEGRESGQSGRASVLRVFDRNGMKCAEVEHVFTTGNPNRYVVPYCRIASGEWRIAF